MPDFYEAERGFDRETMQVGAFSGVGNPGAIGDELLGLHGAINDRLREGGGELAGRLGKLLPLYGDREVAAVCTASSEASAERILARLDHLDLVGGVMVCDLGEKGEVEKFHHSMARTFSDASVVFYGAGDPLAVAGDPRAKDYLMQTEEDRERARLINVGSAEQLMRRTTVSLCNAKQAGRSGVFAVVSSLAGTKLALGTPVQFPYGGHKAQLEQDAVTLANRRNDANDKEGPDGGALLAPHLMAVRVGAVDKRGMFVEHADPEFQKSLPSFMKVTPAQTAAALVLAAYGEPVLKDVPVVSFVPTPLQLAANFDSLRRRGPRGVELSNLPRITKRAANKVLLAAGYEPER